jgi:signal transduction histidine kinase
VFFSGFVLNNFNEGYLFMLDKADFLQLLRQMGHDMRVPLNTIISTGDMLLQGAYDPLSPKQEKAVVRLQRNNQRLLAILDDFMTYVKADAREISLNPKPFEPRVQLEAWSEPIRQASEKQGLSFRLLISENLPTSLTMDELILKKIVQALLWNALAHTSEGEILLQSEWIPEQEWLISVQDTGSGISETDKPHIFEAFWRGEARPQLPTAGAGLGLPMSLALVKLMGGDILLKETTVGCHFSVKIPLEKEIK